MILHKNLYMPDFSVAISLLSKPIEDIYVRSSDAIKSKIALLKASDRMQSLHKRLYESQRIKTLWHTERPLSLNSFYYPVSVSTGSSSNSNSQRLTNLSDFPDNHNIILGTVGQGKSILVRYLLGQEIKSGSHIPLLLELRNIGDNHLLDSLATRFSILLDIEENTTIFNEFAHNGKISFLLDGFDEIEPSHTARIMQEIEDLSYIYHNCRILVTSRPDSDCKHLTNFYSYSIQPLTEDDHLPFYKKITKDEKSSKRLVAAIKNSPTKIQQLVKTPLLATLLAVSYRNSQKIPLDFSEFYDDIFQILLIRHDASKLGWRRARLSKLDDRQIQQIFEAFCFAGRKKQLSSIDQDSAYQIIEQCATETGISADPLNFLTDIKRITCLLVEDGKKFAFVHASVQEFFAARYIKMKTETVASRFYTQLLTDGKWKYWPEEILFLEQIDGFRATKYFLLPDIKNTLQHLHDGNTGTSGFAAIKYLNGMIVRKRKLIRDSKQTFTFYIEPARSIDSYHYKQLDARIHLHLFKPSDKSWNIGFITDPASEKRTYLQIAKDRGFDFFNETIRITEAIIKDMINREINMRNQITQMEAPNTFIDL